VIPGPIGVLVALSREPRTFTKDDIHFLEAVAHVLAATILRKREEGISARAIERVISAQDEERKRIARELHDETGQSLTALLLGLREIEDARTTTAAKAATRRLRRVARRTVDEVGRLARGLHPSVLDDMGLVVAATRLAQDYSSAWGFRVDISTRGLRSRLRAAVERALYRILQEALTNAARHGRPRMVTVALHRGKATVTLSVKDDGAGFDASRAAEAGDRHLGLLGMRERAAILGGTFSVQSKPRKGTEVLVRIPLDAPKTTRRASPSKKSRRSPGG
jgi:signal transduction histidine kinase